MENQNYTEQETTMVKHIDEFSKKVGELRSECLDYVNAFVHQYGISTGENSYNLSLYNGKEQDYIGGVAFCTYNDESHSECQTTINGLSAQQGEIYLVTNDYGNYNIRNIPTYEVVSLAERLLELKEYINV